MAYQMAATAVTFNDLKGHSQVAFSNAIRRTFVQHSTRFQLTVLARFLCISKASCTSVLGRELNASEMLMLSKIC